MNGPCLVITMLGLVHCAGDRVEAQHAEGVGREEQQGGYLSAGETSTLALQAQCIMPSSMRPQVLCCTAVRACYCRMYAEQMMSDLPLSFGLPGYAWPVASHALCCHSQYKDQIEGLKERAQEEMEAVKRRDGLEYIETRPEELKLAPL